MSGSGGDGAVGISPAAPSPLGLWPRVRADRLFVVVLAALIGLAWIGLWSWHESPYGRFLGHGEIEGTPALGGDYLRLLVLFVAGWTLMSVAMMLPTSLPLVTFFRSFVRERADRGLLVVLLVLGYLGLWTAFAAVVHLGDQAVHSSVDRLAWLESNAWSITAATFLVAGLYQFSPLKYRCLDKCRSPVSFVLGNWHGRRERVNAFALGVRHGLFCLGCCWSLMLLMFAVGVGNIGWMLALAAVMAIEKNVTWGRRLSAPVGVVLLAAAGALALAGTLGGAPS